MLPSGVALATLALAVADSAPPTCSSADADHDGNLLQVRGDLAKEPGRGWKVQPKWWYEECVPPFREEGYGLAAAFPPFYLTNHSNYGLYEQPAGLCADSLSCAYKRCVPPSRCSGLDPFDEKTWVSSAQEFTASLEDCPPNNLPSVSVKAEAVTDVIKAIRFARRKNLKVSVKTSGHSYTGSSTFADSVNINMRSYVKYSKYNVFECESVSLPRVLTPHQKEVCRVAAARGKAAVVRVGGGETWNEVYSSVSFLPTPAVRSRYHVVGGAAGTVSSVGGWLQGGGLAGSTGMRAFGFGVDNVLELEMVLSNGKHVRFWPSEWMAEAGKLYPQTTKVAGECNENPVADEAEWRWVECAEMGLEVTFEELWFAVRGGSGGTFGVVTSAYYQLHNQMAPLAEKGDEVYVVYKLPTTMDGCKGEDACIDFIRKLWIRYARDWLFPEAGSPYEGTSKLCGAASSHPLDFFSLVPGFYWCLGQAATAAMIGAWGTYVDGAAADLEKFGLTISDVFVLRQGTFLASGPYPTYFVLSMSSTSLFPTSMREFTTQLPDTPAPATYPDNLIGAIWPALLPFDWLHTDQALDVLLAFAKAGQGSTTYVLGGDTKIAGDGLNAVPEFQRNATFMLFVPGDLEDLIRGAIPAFQGPSERPFPGGAEYNHISAAMLGPQKSNWSMGCNISWSMKKRRRKCVPALESVYGTELLEKLLDVKKRADPSRIFQCYNCVGFEGFKEPEDEDRPGKDVKLAFQSTKKWCAREGYSGGCMAFVDTDPAYLPEERKARNRELRKSIRGASLETKGS